MPPSFSNIIPVHKNVIFLNAIEPVRQSMLGRTITQYFDFYKLQLDSHRVYIANGGTRCRDSVSLGGNRIMYTTTDTIFICDEFSRVNLFHESGHLINGKARFFPQPYMLSSGDEMIGVEGLSVLIRKKDRTRTAFRYITEAACELLAHVFAAGTDQKYSVEHPSYFRLGNALIRALGNRTEFLIACIEQSDIRRLHHELFPQERVSNEYEAIENMMIHFQQASVTGEF